MPFRHEASGLVGGAVPAEQGDRAVEAVGAHGGAEVVGMGVCTGPGLTLTARTRRGGRRAARHWVHIASAALEVSQAAGPDRGWRAGQASIGSSPLGDLADRGFGAGCHRR